MKPRFKAWCGGACPVEVNATVEAVSRKPKRLIMVAGAISWTHIKTDSYD